MCSQKVDKMEKVSPSYMIYLNLEKFAFYRKLNPKGDFPDYKEPDLKNKLINDKFIEFRFEDTIEHFSRDPTETSIILTSGSETAFKSNTLKNIILKKIKLPENKKLDLIIIFEDTIKSAIKKIEQNYMEEHNQVDIFNYVYKNLKFIVPEHESVPLHRILSNKEEEELLSHLNCEKIDLPKIFNTDPAIIWIGAIHNQIIEIHRISDVGIEPLAYRVVI